MEGRSVSWQIIKIDWLWINLNPWEYASERSLLKWNILATIELVRYLCLSNVLLQVRGLKQYALTVCS